MQTAFSRAERIVDALGPALRARAPGGVPIEYLDGYLRRNRSALVGLIARKLDAAEARRRPAPEPEPELWTASQRTAANLAALDLLARKPPQAMSADDLRVLARYSGWGGLSIKKALSRFPADLPAPDAQGLIHEYYTPNAVAQAIAGALRPLLPTLPAATGRGVLALEPSAGIGRILRPMTGRGWERLDWTAIELSPLSARLLRALLPGVTVYESTFEQWVAEHGPELAGTLGLLVSNPPYGVRSASATTDPDRDYREDNAYAYFLRRGLDLLAGGGLGVFLIPAGFLSGRRKELVELRRKVLLRHHLAAAYRLPSIGEDGRGSLFPGALLVTDLLFFRARGGELDTVHAQDRFILEGAYFKDFPQHILGEEVGRDAGADGPKVRGGYQVRGAFTGLPSLRERPVCVDCGLRPLRGSGRAEGGVLRVISGARDDLPDDESRAVALGLRVDQYLALLAAEDAERPRLLWRELHDALLAWAQRHGHPLKHKGLATLAARGNTGAQRFRAAWSRDATLIEGLSRPPTWAPRYAGRADDVVALADWIYRQEAGLSTVRLHAAHRSLGGRLNEESLTERLIAAGWCLDGERWDELIPGDRYVQGSLWPRYDRAKVRADAGDLQAASQAERLLRAIQPAVFDDIEALNPRQSWLPLTVIEAWVNEALRSSDTRRVRLERRDGLLQIGSYDYDDLNASKKHATSGVDPQVLWYIGWVNHDFYLFKPEKKGYASEKEDIDQARLRQARAWEASFRAWLASHPEHRGAIEHTYNQSLRGYVEPTYSADPLPVARWASDGPTLKDYQVRGARKVIANRGGLLAFDVGLGKTYTAISVIATGRQEGWIKRPAVVVPNSIIWKWVRDFARCLPDYRVVVIGSSLKVGARGRGKGRLRAVVDTPAERAHKWTQFQAGDADVVLITYSALGRTRVNAGPLVRYANRTAAIQREIALRRRNIQSRDRELSERDEALLKHGAEAWISMQMELPNGWAYDPGIAWDDLGIDFLVCDESQNFKNLFLVEEREGGLPDFMGNAGEGSKRAWQLDFRCNTIRERTGGAGIMLLSATPAKNSPLEFYNMLQFVNPNAWSRIGIPDPESFIDRFCKLESRETLDLTGRLRVRLACTAFQNLHELRDVLHRYGEFRTAEDVGLKLPKPVPNRVEVDLDPAQRRKIDAYCQLLADLDQKIRKGGIHDPDLLRALRLKQLGVALRVDLVGVHAMLDEVNAKDEDEDGRSKTPPHKNPRVVGVSPHSPKIDAAVERILEKPQCGHIVFCDNVAVHWWMREALVEAGIDRGRIAILNAIEAKDPETRQKIAEDFNGAGEHPDDPEYEPPRYDVVIANAVAYEGVDLQRRTCAIHHLDLPWEPATLQQRNGRGVRQGNALDSIALYYYLAKRVDGRRFSKIDGKATWMRSLLSGQDRVTNNPAAEKDDAMTDLLIELSCNPEMARAIADERRAQILAAAALRARTEAVRLLHAIQSRYRRATTVSDPAEAARLRAEGEERLSTLSRVDSSAWPWFPLAGAVRDQPLYIQDQGPPLYAGLRLQGADDGWYEVGRVGEGSDLPLREAGGMRWRVHERAEIQALTAELGPERVNPPGWPDEERRLIDARPGYVDALVRHGWDTEQWASAPDGWQSRVWSALGQEIRRGLEQGQLARREVFPVVHTGLLSLRVGAELGRDPLVPPTVEGWARLLALIPESEHTFTELDELTRRWWGRPFPRGLLRRGAHEEEP